jgi:hypothetical protein
MNHLAFLPLYLFYIILFVFAISTASFFKIEKLNAQHLTIFFFLKVLGGIALTLIYTCYYTDQSKADIYRFFNDSKVISSVLYHNKLAWFKIVSGIGTYDDDAFAYLVHTQYFSHPAADFATSNSFLIRFISVLNFFSCSNIYIDTLFFDFITFSSLVLLYRPLQAFFPQSEKFLRLPLFLIPSVIFWSSGLLKEPLLITGISVYLYIWLSAGSRQIWVTLIWLLLALIFISLLKIYAGGILVLCSLFLPFNKSFTSLPYPVARRLALFLVIIAGGWYFLSPKFCEKIIHKRDEFVLLSITEKSGSALDMQMSEPDCQHMLSLVPSGLVNAIFRPFVWEGGKLFQKLFGFETLVMFVFIAVLFTCFKIPDSKKLSLALFFLSFALLNYLMIGLTIPVLGAIVHYRITSIMFFLIGILMLTDLPKLQSKFA